MDVHASELLQFAWWALITIGGAGVAALVWGGRQVLARLDSIEAMLASEVKTLNAIQHNLDVRLTRVEERCSIVTANNSGHRRRATDQLGE